MNLKRVFIGIIICTVLGFFISGLFLVVGNSGKAIEVSGPVPIPKGGEIHIKNERQVNQIVNEIRNLDKYPVEDVKGWYKLRLKKGATTMRKVNDLLIGVQPTPEIRLAIADLMWSMQKRSIEESDCSVGFTTYYPYYKFLSPTVACETIYRAGWYGDGGKGMCNLHKVKKHPDEMCRVYSAGSSTEISFDLDVHLMLGCEVHSFDPTLDKKRKAEVEKWLKAGKSKIEFHENAIGWVGGPKKMRGNPMWSLTEIAKKLGHDRVDILKMDIEGGEFNVMKSVFEKEGDILKKLDVKFIMCEVHDHKNDHSCAGMKKNLYPLIKMFYDNGYYMYYQESNIRYHGGQEFSFIRKDLI